jgi:aldehyde:ferredoxin oxidoreductase
MYGHMGKMLRVDLTEHLVTDEVLSAQYLKQWMGGTSLGVKHMCDEVPPKTAWDAPENHVCLSAGPLGGTTVKGSGTIGVVTKGAMTNGLAASQSNGFLGAFLKFNGYDSLVVQGVSPDWVYLYLDGEGHAELRSAEHLVGLDTTQTQDVLHGEWGTKPAEMSVYCIGPAGEHQVKFAMWTGDYGHVAAHNGIGAVLGSKRLKAIAVKRGKQRVDVAHKQELKELAAAINQRGKSTIPGRDGSSFGTNMGHIPMHGMGALPVKNLTTSVFPAHVDFAAPVLRERFEYRRRPCWGCNWSHCGTLTIKEGPNAGFSADEPEYESMVAMGPLVGITDPEDALMLSDTLDRLGMDANEAGWVVAWAIECYETGLFSKQRTGGLELTWGNAGAIRELLECIALRRGEFGAFLADGVRLAAKREGGEAQRRAVYTEKGNTPRGHDHRAVWDEYFDTCVSSTGTVEVCGGGIDVTQHGGAPVTDRFAWEQIVRRNVAVAGRRVFEDSLGICRLSACEDIQMTVQALSLTFGEEYTYDDAMTVGRRAINLMRLYNARAGLSAEMDAPSERYRSPILDGPAQGADIGAVLEQMKHLYYELMGWDTETGIPLESTLAELGAIHE